MVPDPDQRTATLAANVTLFIEHALAHGHIDVIEDDGRCTAAAVWFSLRAGPILAPDD